MLPPESLPGNPRPQEPPVPSAPCSKAWPSAACWHHLQLFCTHQPVRGQMSFTESSHHHPGSHHRRIPAPLSRYTLGPAQGGLPSPWRPDNGALSPRRPAASGSQVYFRMSFKYREGRVQSRGTWHVFQRNDAACIAVAIYNPWEMWTLLFPD